MTVHDDSPEAAYRAFFDTFNAHDAEGWAGVMSYPHVRVSARGTPRLYATPREYATQASWERFEETGWVRTQGIAPQRLHESANKVHLAGGWTRFDAKDRPIAINRMVYVLTRIDGSWGIQARFGVDSWTGAEAAEAATSAVDLVERYLDAWDAQDLTGCAQYAHFPLIQVGVGEVDEVPDRAALTRLLSALPWARVLSREAVAAQAGSGGVNVAVSVALEGGRREDAVFLVAERDGRWGIVARSLVMS